MLMKNVMSKRIKTEWMNELINGNWDKIKKMQNKFKSLNL